MLFRSIYGVGGKAGNLVGVLQPGGNPFEGPRSAEFPNPPTSGTLSGSLFANAARELGYTPFITATSAMTRDYVNPYGLALNRCLRGGYCSSFGCANGAKAGPLTAVLPALLRQRNYELRPLCNVIKVNLDDTGRRAIGVTYIDAAGRTVEQPAEQIGRAHV